MKLRISSAALVGLAVGFATSSQAAVISTVVGYAGPGVDLSTVDGGVSGTTLTGIATFTAIAPFDVALGLLSEGGDCSASANSSSPSTDECTTYSFQLEVTNGTVVEWTDFHLLLGYSGYWDVENDDYPTAEDGGIPNVFEPITDLSGDQPISLTSVNLFGQVLDLNNGFDRGIDWLFPEPVKSGEAVKLSFQAIFGDPGSGTDFNLDYYRYSEGGTTGDTGYVLTARLVPTTVPEPGTLALLGLGLAGIGAVRRKKLAA